MRLVVKILAVAGLAAGLHAHAAGPAKDARQPAYRDLCAEHGLKQALGHSYDDPAGYWGHCKEREFENYHGVAGWLLAVQPGSVRPITPWPTKAEACNAATQQMRDFEAKRNLPINRAKPIVERSPCVCETGLYEFKKTSNPNGWGCSIYFRE